jgi:hypothetical protein
MITLAELWMPILLSAILVWIASSLVWMVLPWHKRDWRALPNEEAARSALKGTPPGQYSLPHMTSMQQMKDPAYQRKLQEGPLAFITVRPSGIPTMGKQMVVWFVFIVLVSVVVAYVVSRTVAPGTEYLEVFRVAGVVAWLAYGGGTFQEAIWFGRPWRMVVGLQVDSLIYALLTAGVFGWLWPGT